MSSASASLAVLKLGGSVLTSLSAYARTAAFIEGEIRAAPARRLLAVVSAEYGHTDELADEAGQLSTAPDATSLDLLWATGELQSVALLTMALRARGMSAAGLDAHQTGLRAQPGPVESGGPARLSFHLLTLRAALARHAVVVVPGFLATRQQQLVTLGRGGSDLSAVLIAVALGASECVLIKDVDGYFTDDPAVCPHARRIERLTYAEAVAKAAAGCPLVQRQAVEAGQRANLRLIVRSVTGAGTTVSNSGAGRD